MNRPELAALQNRRRIPQQKSEPAPIDETNEVTPPVDANIKAKAEAEIKATHSDLPLMMTEPVAGLHQLFFQRGRGVLEHGLVRSGRYQEMIQRVLQEEGVPQDLIYLAQAESDSSLWRFPARAPAACGNSCPAAARVTASSATGGWTIARTRKKPPAPPPII